MSILDQPECVLESFRGYLRVLARLNVPNRFQAKLDPSDLVQETLLRAYAHARQFRGQTTAELAVWLRQILAHTMSNSIRDLTRDKRNCLLEQSLEQGLASASGRFEKWLASTDLSPSQRHMQTERLLHVAHALDQLPSAQREALVLKYCQELTLKEIGQRLGRTPDAVASLLQRGLRSLRGHLESR